MQLPQISYKAIKSWVLDFRRDVIRMMRLKFICVAMAILIGVFIIMLSAINMIMNTVSQSQSMKLLQQIADSDRYNTLETGSYRDDFHYEEMAPPDAPNGEAPPDGSEPPEKPSGEDVPPPEPSDVHSAELSEGVLPLAFRDPSENWGWGWGWDEDQDSSEEGNYYYYPGQGGWNNPQPPAEDDDNDDSDDDEQQPTRETRDNRPPWERDDDERERPSEDVPPPWATEAPVTDAPPADPLPTDPVPADVPREEPVPPEEVPPETPEPVTEELTEPSEESLTESETETETETETQTETERHTETHSSSQNPPEPREPRVDRWKVPITIDHFAIMVSTDGSFLGLRNTEDYTDEEAEEIMNGILARSKTQGMYGWLQYCTAQKAYGTLIVITDKTSDQGILNNLFRTTVIVGILMLLVLLTILIFLSRWITQPVQQAFKRQKQFVSDAGHELKTPIAVLTTNADILQDEIGENKWLVYMQEQIGRMNQLVGDLLRLARMDNATQEYHFEDFDLSMAVAATTLPFESSAFEQHKTLEMDVQPGVHYRGSEQHIRQLCAIFIDNALKYSNDNGIIKVTLLQRGDHQILEFYNTGCEISQAETEKIFERFYRGDKARNSTKKSGYGLGLAIAKSIMDVHKIKIQVTCEQDKWIRFLLIL